MVHFSQCVAITDPNADKHVDVLPPINYDKKTKTFSYLFNGKYMSAKDLFVSTNDTVLKEKIVRMGTTEGSTGKRDFCFI